MNDFFSHFIMDVQLNPIISRAVNSRKSVMLAPWNSNFSDSSLTAAHMTKPVTHMCWSEQISPLVHSSLATWQPFHLSHCIEMHNSHLLGHVVVRVKRLFHTFGLILTPRNQLLTVNKQSDNGRHCESPGCYTNKKSESVFRCKYSLEVDITDL